MSSVIRDFTPKGKLWASDNSILIGQAIRINITRPSRQQYEGQSLISNTSSYLSEGRRPQLFTSDPKSFRINEYDAMLFDGCVGAFIAANDNVLVGFTNGLEFMFNLCDVEIYTDSGDLTSPENLPNILFLKKDNTEKMNKEKYPGETAFYEATIIAMIRDGAVDADILHKRAMALIINRRKLFNEN